MLKLQANAQNSIKQYVKKAIVPINSIDPLVTDYTDFEEIGKAGNARIVMLGEQDHGDAPTFLAKTKLIKYLHEQKGFNVLAFESDFFGLNYGWDNVAKTSPAIDSFLSKNIFPVWTHCHTCTELFYQYIPATHKTVSPLHITGFDSQLIMGYSVNRLVPTLDSLLSMLELPITKHPEYRTVILPMIDALRKGYGGTGENFIFFPKLIIYLKEIQQQVSFKLKKDDFWRMLMDNLVASADEYLILSKDIYKGNNIRDNQMANNLAWLSDNKYPNEKIIVWAANGHIAKVEYSYSGSNDAKLRPMGYFFTRDTTKLNKTYILGFDSYSGIAGRLTMSNNYTLQEPEYNGFERWINPSYPYAFIDWKQYNKIMMNPFI